MKIATRLKLAALVPALMTLLISLALYLSYRVIEEAQEKDRTAQRIMTGMHELNSLARAYMLHHEERPKQQFLQVHEDLSRLIAVTRFKGAEQALLENIRQNSELMKASFLRLVLNYERHDSLRDSALLREAEERLAGQLDIRSHHVVSAASRLESMIDDEITATQKRISALMLVLVIALVIPLTIVLLRMMRSIAVSLTTLRKGTEIIGGGNLEHRIGMTSPDELGQLSSSIDRMTGQLQAVTVSKDELLNEIAEREKAEGAVRESEQRLRFALESCQIGALDIDLVDHTAFRSPEHDRIFGYDQLLPQWTLADLLKHALPEYRDPVETMVREATAARTGWTYECRIRRADGAIRWIWFSGRHYTDDSGHDRVAGVVMDITARKQAEEAIKASLREKEVLLKEIHHRVKNNLQVISSLVGMQCDISKDETVRGTLSDVTDRVRSMALVHEKLYQSESLARIDFAEYAQSLLGYLWRAHGAVAGAVRLTLDLEPVSVPVDIAVPCGLILNELAGNALKHAFRGRSEGEVTVSLHGDSDGRTCLRVSDNGVGLPPGFDWRQSRSLGLRLVQMLAGQLDATVEENGKDGTRFELVIEHAGS